MVHIGWKAAPEQYPPLELVEYAVSADRAGFDLIDVSDHFHPWSEQGQACFTWTWLGAAAPQVQHSILSSGVTCPILRYHPSVIAQAAATVTHFAPQRFWLGVGTGEALNEFAATGEWPSYGERRERLAEAIELMRALWSGDEVSYDGGYYQTRKAKLYTPPVSPIPIIVSAMVPASASFAGRYGDGLWSVGGKEPALYQSLIRHFEEGASQAGKDPARLPRLIELNVAYNEPIDAAIQEQLKYWAGSYVPALYDQNIYSPAMSAENGSVVGPDTIKKTGCFSANPDDHIRFAQQYVDLGFDTLIFHSAGPDQRAFLEGYARDILPKLRTLSKQPERLQAGGR